MVVDTGGGELRLAGESRAGAVPAHLDHHHLVGLALLRLRRQAGMTVRQLAAVSGQPVAALNRYEEGQSLPRTETLRWLLEAMGAIMMDLYRAQQDTDDNGGTIEDGTLPPDTRTPPAPPQHKAAVRLAQECGKAMAHCCLAFLELQAGGWHDTEPTTNGQARKGTQP